MPGLDYKSLPVAQVKEISDGLNARWKIESNVIAQTQFPDRGKHQAAKAKLNAKYQRLELDALTELQGQVQADRRKEEAILGYQKEYKDEGMTPQRRAVIEGKYTEEEELAIFGAKPKYLTPAYLRSSGFRENRKAYADAAPFTAKWFTGRANEPKTKQGLVDQYERWRESELYDTKNVQEQQQLDREWNTLMLGSSIYDEWWQDKSKRKPVVEARALQSTGRVAKAMQRKVAGQTPLGRSLSINKKSFAQGRSLSSDLPAGGYFSTKDLRKEQPQQKSIKQRNRKTGQERISYDGGKTWEAVR